MKLLIAYGTTEGQTRKVAEYIKTEAIKAGVVVAMFDTTAKPISPSGFDAIIICASMHMHRYQTGVADYISSNFDALYGKPTAFVSVSLSAVNPTDDDESYREMKDATEKFLHFTRWNPTFTEYVAGALRFTKYDFFKKYIMRQIAQKTHKQVSGDEDVEYTNWAKLSAFVTQFIKTANVTATKLAEEIL